MELGTGLFPQQRQQLTVRQLQYLELLALSAADLEVFVNRELEENPALEFEPSEDSLLERAEWLRAQGGASPGVMSIAGAPETGSRDRRSLFEHICAQIAESAAPETVRRAAVCVAGAMDADGLLEESDAELAAELGIEADVVLKARKLIQSLEPAGVGARDITERLLLQLKRTEQDTSLAERIVTGEMERLALHRYAAIAHELGVTERQVMAAREQILSLDPDPMREFGEEPAAHYIIPDIIVTADGMVRVTDGFDEGLRVSVYYRELAAASDDEQLRAYLRDRLSRAAWVVDSVRRRRNTLEKCAAVIVELQRDFVQKGEHALTPMTLAMVAERLGVHESTISRIIREKYIQCPHGLYSLRSLFTRALTGGLSAAKAKAVIRELVAAEDKRRPMSDERLRELMAERGLQLSRRTVAKYRAELGIASAPGRRQKPDMNV